MTCPRVSNHPREGRRHSISRPDQIRVRVPPQAAEYEYDWDRASTGGTLRITGTEPLSLGSEPRTPRSPVHPMVPLSCCLKRHSGSPGVRLPHRQDTRPQATAQHFVHANSRAWESAQPKRRPITRGRGAIRSATRSGDRSESSLSDQLPCPCRTAHRLTAQNRTRTQRSGTRTRREGQGR